MNYKKLFLKSNLDDYKKLIKHLNVGFKSLNIHSGNAAVYPTFDKISRKDILENSAIPEQGIPLFDLLNGVYNEFAGCVKTGHPFSMKNILPQPNIAGLIGLLLGNVYMANGVTGEDSGALLDCELKCSSAIAKLVGYNQFESAGVFTYGGSGTNLYALKVGLTKANKNSVEDGKISNTFVIGSTAAHYSHLTDLNWLGIGEKKLHSNSCKY